MSYIGLISTYVRDLIFNTIVLRLYRTPPRYGPEMADVTRKFMTYAIFIHFGLAFYMYSNSQIFTYSSSFAWLDQTKSSAVNIEGVLGKNNYLSGQRLS